MHVRRQEVVREHVAKRRAEHEDELDRAMSRLDESGRSDDVAAVRDASCLAGACGAVLEPASDRTVAAFELATRAGSATWTMRRAGGQALQLPIASSTLQRIEGTPAEAPSRRWLDDFWLALLTDDAEASAALCYGFKLERGERHVTLLADAMRRYWLHDDTAAQPLLEALRATDPAQQPADEVDRVLDLDVPVMEVVFALFEGNAAKLDAALAKGFEMHRRHWNRSANDERGWISLPLAALQAQARRNGTELTVSSDYAPLELLEALDHRDPTLILCPYCVSPIREGMQVCPLCLDDVTADAPIESDITDYLDGAHKPCSTCKTPIPTLAVKCASCRTWLR